MGASLFCCAVSWNGAVFVRESMPKLDNFSINQRGGVPDIDREISFPSQMPVLMMSAMASIGMPELVRISSKGRTLDSDDNYLLVFPLTEGIYVTEAPYQFPLTRGNEIFFIPSYTRVRVNAAGDSGWMLVYRFFASIQLCEGRLCPETDGDTALDDTEHPTERKAHTTQIIANKPTLIWRDSVAQYIAKGQRNSAIYEYKLRELFWIFRTLYDPNVIDDFLKEYHCHHSGFRSFVFHHFMDARNVEELADLAGLSLSTFKRVFKDEFHQSPLQWIHKQKAYFLYHDLTQTDIPLKDLAERYMLSSVSYLCAFCKRMLGDTPHAIRQSAGRVCLD